MLFLWRRPVPFRNFVPGLLEPLRELYGHQLEPVFRNFLCEWPHHDRDRVPTGLYRSDLVEIER